MKRRTIEGECSMTLSQLLDIRPGVTAVIGGGGKTTLLRTLGEELAGQHPVLLCTTTKILPFSDLPCARTAAELDELRRAHQLLCAGTDEPGTGKLTAPETPMAVLAEQFDYILVEADGAARHPLKAHAEYEPAIPPCADAAIAVMGLDALGRPLAESVHRPERAAALLGGDTARLVTPDMAATLLLHPNGPFRHAPARRALMLNKSDLPGGEAAALAVARAVAVLAPTLPCHTGSLAAGESRLLA